MKPFVYFAIIGLLVLATFSQIPFANATTLSKISTGTNKNVIDIQYQPSTGLLWALVASSSLNLVYLDEITPSTGTIVASYNVTQSSTLLAQALWCGQTDCFIGFTNAGNTAGRVIKVTSVTVSPITIGDITGTYNTASSGVQRMTGRDAVTGGFGSITIYLSTKDSSNVMTLYYLDGISMTTSASSQINVTSPSGSDFIDDMQWSGISGSTDNTLSITGVIDGSSKMKIYNLATQSFVCSTNNYGIYMTGVFPDYTNNKIFVGWATGQIKVFNKSCVLQTDISAVTTGLSQQIRLLTELPLKGKMYVQESGANGFISEMNYTSGSVSTYNSIISPFPSTSQSAFLGHSTYDNIHDLLFVPYSGADNAILIINFGTGGSSTSTTCTIDVNGDGIPDVTYRDTNGDGVCDAGLAGSAGLVRNSQNVTTISNRLAYQLGFIEDPTSDIKSNGVGYLVYLVGLVVFIGLAVGVFRKNILANVPIMIYVIIMIGWAGACAGLHILDSTLFYVTIFVVVALGGIKISERLGFIPKQGDGGE